MFYKVITFCFILFFCGNLNTSFSQTAPTLLTPANGSTCNELTVKLSWSNVTNLYEILLSSTPAQTDTLFWTFVRDTTDYTLTVTNFNMTYYWNVTGVFSGGTKAKSSTFNFKTKNAPPQLSGPTNNQACLNRKVTFSWTNFSASSRYQLQISEYSDFLATVYDVDTITTLNHTVNLPNHDKTYYWRVRGVQPCETDFSAVRYFTTFKAPPTPTSPTDGETFVGLRAVLKWTATGSPVSFNYQVSDDSLFSVLLFDQATTRYFDTVDLGENNKTFYWRVKAIYSDCETEFSKFKSFKTLYNGPRLFYPRNDTNCAPLIVRFSWEIVPSATAYRFQASESVDFFNIALDTAGIATNFATIKLPKGLKKYFWRVRGEDSKNKGAWSPDTFSINTNIEIPDRISPANNDMAQSITVLFKWKQSALKDVTYRIQVSIVSDFKTTEIDTSLKDAGQISLKLKNFYMKYYWRITTLYSTCKNEWSDPWVFGTVILPPNLLTPKNNATKQPLNIDFSWEKVEGADYYEFNLAEESDFAKLLYGKKGIPNNSLLVRDKLEPSKTYFWRVNAYSSLGTSIWSSTFKFTTGAKPLDAPILLLPANSSTNLAVDQNLSWNSVIDAAYYHIQVADNSNFTKPILDEGNQIKTNQEVYDLEYNKTYYWRVAALNDSSESQWSETWKFSTIVLAPSDPVSLLKPENDADDVTTNTTFTWSHLARADNYEFQLSLANTFLENDLVINDSNVTETQRYITGLSLGTTYYWRILGKNSGGKGPWSEIRKFKTIITSVEENNNVSNIIRISPNPVSSELFININILGQEKIDFHIYDILGNQVKHFYGLNTTNTDNSIMLNVNDLSEGIYYIRLFNGGKYYIEKFIVKR